MRSVVALVLLLTCVACDNTPVDNTGGVDSAIVEQNADDVYSRMLTSANVIALPGLVETDSMLILSGIRITERNGFDLLPGDFEPESYRTVYCIGRSTINSQLNALWFKLTSEGEFEEAPEIIDIIMVLYNKSGQPIDVFLTATKALGYSYSYVRTDSVFTVEFDEMEDIIVTTSMASISETGFMPSSSETSTFKYGTTGKAESHDFANDYLNSHGMNSRTELNQ